MAPDLNLLRRISRRNSKTAEPSGEGASSKGDAKGLADGRPVDALEVLDSLKADTLNLILNMAKQKVSFIIIDMSQTHYPIVYCSHVFSDLTGYNPEEVLGRSCSFLEGPDTDVATINRIREGIQNGEVVEEVVLNYTKTGRAFWNMLSLTPLRSTPNGPYTYYLGVQKDVTASVACAVPAADPARLPRVAAAEEGLGYGHFVNTTELPGERFRPRPPRCAAPPAGPRVHRLSPNSSHGDLTKGLGSLNSSFDSIENADSEQMPLSPPASRRSSAGLETQVAAFVAGEVEGLARILGASQRLQWELQGQSGAPRQEIQQLIRTANSMMAAAQVMDAAVKAQVSPRAPNSPRGQVSPRVVAADQTGTPIGGARVVAAVEGTVQCLMPLFHAKRVGLAWEIDAVLRNNRSGVDAAELQQEVLALLCAAHQASSSGSLVQLRITAAPGPKRLDHESKGSIAIAAIISDKRGQITKELQGSFDLA